MDATYFAVLAILLNRFSTTQQNYKQGWVAASLVCLVLSLACYTATLVGSVNHQLEQQEEADRSERAIQAFDEWMESRGTH